MEPQLVDRYVIRVDYGRKVAHMVLIRVRADQVVDVRRADLVPQGGEQSLEVVRSAPGIDDGHDVVIRVDPIPVQHDAIAALATHRGAEPVNGPGPIVLEVETHASKLLGVALVLLWPAS